MPPNCRVIPLHPGVTPAICSPNLTIGQIGDQVGASIDQVGMTSDPVSTEAIIGVAPRTKSQVKCPPDIHQNQIVTQLQHLPRLPPVPRHQRSRSRYFFTAEMTVLVYVRWSPKRCSLHSVFPLCAVQSIESKNFYNLFPPQEAPLPGPDTVSYAAVTQRPKPPPKQANPAGESAGKEPPPAQSPSKQETASSQTQRTDKQTSSGADSEQPANRQREECSEGACKSSPLKEEGDSSVEQNH